MARTTRKVPESTRQRCKISNPDFLKEIERGHVNFGQHFDWYIETGSVDGNRFAKREAVRKNRRNDKNIIKNEKNGWNDAESD